MFSFLDFAINRASKPCPIGSATVPVDRSSARYAACSDGRIPGIPRDRSYFASSAPFPPLYHTPLLEQLFRSCVPAVQPWVTILFWWGKEA